MKHKKFVPVGAVCAVIWFAVEYLWSTTVMAAPMQTNRLAGIPWHNPTTHGLGALALVALLFGFGFAALFLGGYHGKGKAEGVRFAIWVTLVASVMPNVSFAAMLHVGRHATAYAIVGDFVTFVICGVAAATMAGSGALAAAASA